MKTVLSSLKKNYLIYACTFLCGLVVGVALMFLFSGDGQKVSIRRNTRCSSCSFVVPLHPQ